MRACVRVCVCRGGAAPPPLHAPRRGARGRIHACVRVCASMHMCASVSLVLRGGGGRSARGECCFCCNANTEWATGSGQRLLPPLALGTACGVRVCVRVIASVNVWCGQRSGERASGAVARMCMGARAGVWMGCSVRVSFQRCLSLRSGEATRKNRSLCVC